jgi:hypothetical protein
VAAGVGVGCLEKDAEANEVVTRWGGREGGAGGGTVWKEPPGFDPQPPPRFTPGNENLIMGWSAH